MPSKRERGKQRKAAKKQAGESDTLALVKKGDNFTTVSIAQTSQLPLAYRVSGAGTEFVNGLYELDKDCIYNDNDEIQYHYVVPDNASDGVGKKLTLFRCTMRSQHKWWFISEADAAQPGSDKDIDYYQFKSMTASQEEIPNLSGWVTIKMGSDPPPTLEAVGKVEDLDLLPSGILPVVLHFLQRCENVTFAKVLLDAGGGNLRSSATWIKVLSRVVPEESSRLQVAQNIGPLVKCMCNDTKRVLFKSKKHWKEALFPFVKLISKMLSNWSSINYTQNDFMLIKVLFQHEGLLPSTIQWVFWTEEYRPDLVYELGIQECNKVVTLGRDIIWKTVRAINQHLEDGKGLLEIVGTTPIISKEFDSNCMISCVEGFVRQMKINGLFATTLECLIENADCVDKGAITEIIDVGTVYYDNDIAESVLWRLYLMITKKEANTRNANDTRVAFAIRIGLIEMCLSIIEQFGTRECFERDESIRSYSGARPIFHGIKGILKTVHEVSLHQKTAKAIRSKKEDIEQDLVRLEQNADLANNPKRTTLFDMVRSILNLNGSYCCRCNKSLRKTEVKLCNGCGCMTYCSRACQEKDWLNGHKLTCGKTYTNETVGHFQGRVLPRKTLEDERNETKLKHLVINVNMIQLKLFLDHSERILSQARALGVPLCDVVVVFGLIAFPPRITVMKYTDYFNPESKKSFEDSRSIENITCAYVSQYYGNSEKSSRLVVQRIFDCSWLQEEKGISEKLDWVDILQTL